MFVGGLPPSVTEGSLVTFLEKYGKVRHITLKYDTAGQFKGFAFVTMEDKKVAELLCSTKGLEYDGKAIDCRRPLDSSGGAGDGSPKEARVFVGGLPRSATKEAVETHFSQYGQVASIKLKYDSTGTFRGFAFVTFEDKATAELACLAKGQRVDGKVIDCRLADSGQEIASHEKMFVGGVPKNTTPQEIEDHFRPYGRVVSVDLKHDEATGKFRGYCFVTFENKDVAEEVYRNHGSNQFKGRWIDCRPYVRKPAIDSAVNAVLGNAASEAAQQHGILSSSGDGGGATGVAEEGGVAHMLQQYSEMGGTMVPTLAGLAPWADQKTIERARASALRQGISSILGTASLKQSGIDVSSMASAGLGTRNPQGYLGVRPDEQASPANRSSPY